MNTGRIESARQVLRCSILNVNRGEKCTGVARQQPVGEPQLTKYFLSNLPAVMPLKALVNTLKIRWRIEHDYRELKEEVGLDH
jgi:SRSO17 transposase